MKKITESLSFVIPCYRSEHTIQSVIEEIKNWVDLHDVKEWEIIAVNDCSPDGVQEVLEKIASDNQKIKVIELAKNMGKHAAMLAGYSKVSGTLIVNLDDDGQCPVDQLNLLLDEIERGADIALAKYRVKKQSVFKRFGSLMNQKMAQIMIGQPKDIQISNFSVIRRIIVEEMIKYQNPYPYVSGLMLRSTKHIVNVQMDERERLYGSTNYTFIKSIKLWLNGFTAFSVIPLRIATMAGMCCTVIGVVSGLYVVIKRLLNPAILAGYSSLMAALLFIGGMIMLMLGMIGEYIGRIYISINNSPQYVIRQTINIEKSERQSKMTEGSAGGE